jgi:hypothetical protein
MVHDEETNVSIKQHKRKFDGTVIVHNTCGFVGKSSETEDVGDRVVVYVVNNVKVGFGVGDVVNVNGWYEAGHDGVMDLGWDIDPWNLWSGAAEVFLRPFHVPL